MSSPPKADWNLLKDLFLSSSLLLSLIGGAYYFGTQSQQLKQNTQDIAEIRTRITAIEETLRPQSSVSRK